MKAILRLPEDIIKRTNKRNWKRLFNTYMVFDGDYVWSPSVMRDFISKIVKEV